MIKNLKLENFKSIVKQDFNFKMLNVLTGLNGSGKSSVLQVLALLKQSLDIDESGKILFLVGNLISLGKSSDILYELASNNNIKIDISSCYSTSVEASNIVLNYSINESENNDIIQGNVLGDSNVLKKNISNFQYIQADRISPRNSYPQASTFNRATGWLGVNGEYTIDYIQQNEDVIVSEKRCMKKEYSSIPEDFLTTIAPTLKLTDQISAWLQEISPGAQLNAEKIDHIDATTLAFKYKTISQVTSSDRRPINVGYGLTYSLPIITSCLTAKQGSILLLENPEAHLHPRGQLKLGILLALCAQDGVQIFVETHSDHLLNGIRLATKKNIISAENVEVFYFDRDYETGITQVIYPQLQENGRFLNWPEGFFDEWEKALDELLS
ncbi:DUF3696 domain-containing protein [Acinetobacter sp. V2]|uniref:DUF3696 domain-containing protein n=1 Tax=Acinetobacter sp. V2 TaxID=1051623 RepID=UPI00061F9E66|nr:DUF3696 domain-containing protein [Acinetobacter sp. V2]KKC44652.1 hypothetical protein UC75_03580 [Acinetobacter sp. V2]